MILEGKKTYITAVVLGLASFALAMGWLNKEQYQVIVGLVSSLGLAALRSGVAKANTDTAREVDQKAPVTVSGIKPLVEGKVGGTG